MQTIHQASQNKGNSSFLSAMGGPMGRKTVAQAQTHCWYCNEPLNGYRRFCSKECEEAIYEDNEAARKRRLIFGCQC